MQKILQKNYHFLLFVLILLATEGFHYFLVKKTSVSINDGLFFGFLKNNVLVGVLPVILLIIALLFSKNKKYLYFPFSMLAAGSLVNILDRWFYGGSVDYIKIWFIPDFNLPDIFIVVGTFFYMFNFLAYKKTSK